MPVPGPFSGPLPQTLPQTLQVFSFPAESGATLLDHILKALEECGPAQPLPQNVWAVCSVATHTKLISKPWAPNTVADDHIVSVDCNTENLIDCLEAFTRSSAYARLRDASTLLILDACSICAWPSTLVRFMTHSLLRDEVCIARTREDTWAGPSAARVRLLVEQDSYNARVAEAQQDTSLQQNSCHNLLLCPLFSIPQRQRHQFFQAVSKSASLLQLLQALLSAPIYSLPIDCCLWLSGSESLGLLQAYQSSMQSFAVGAPCQPPIAVTETNEQAALRSLSSLVSNGSVQDASSATRMPLATAVRASPATYLPGHAHRARQQHPVYSTSNNAYGSKAPSLHELPLSWHGIRGDFTRKQATGKVVTTGLKTAISNHAVADTLHELGL